MAQTSIITGQYVCIHQKAATIVQRVLAWVVDIIILTVGSVIFIPSAAALSSFSSQFTVVAIVLSVLAILAYPMLMEIFANGQTIGKVVVGIRVMSLDGSRPSKTASMLRWLLLIVDGSMGLGILFLVFTKNCQRIGDLAAGTTVVKTNRERRPFSLNSYQFADRNYLPSYPEAANLSMRQLSVIERVLYSDNRKKRDGYIRLLAEKVEETLGVKRKEAHQEDFLRAIYNDFQYYAINVV